MSTLFVQFSHTFVLKGDLIEYNTLVRQYGGELFYVFKTIEIYEKVKKFISRRIR